MVFGDPVPIRMSYIETPAPLPHTATAAAGLHLDVDQLSLDAPQMLSAFIVGLLGLLLLFLSFDVVVVLLHDVSRMKIFFLLALG